MRTKTIFNILGTGLSAIGVYLLLTSNQLIFGLILSLMGAIIYGGLPRGNTIKRLVRIAPRTLLVSVALVIFYIKYFGKDMAFNMIIGALIGVFIIQNFIIHGFVKMLKD